MNHLIVYAHPFEDSFNHAILEMVVNTLQNNGDNVVVVRDLYQMDFKSVLDQEDFNSLRKKIIPEDIKKEQLYIKDADVITLIYPLWWAGMPAILKGYIDRVFSYGFAYQYNQEGIVEGLLGNKKGLMITTHGTPKLYYNASGMTTALRHTTDTGIYEFCGMKIGEHLFFGGVPTSDEMTRNEILEKVKIAFVR